MSDAQINARTKDDSVAFDLQIASYLRATYPHTPIAESRFATDIAAAREYAEYLGFRRDAHIVDIVEASFVRGGGIFHDPVFHHIVDRAVWGAEDKCRVIRERFIHPMRKA